MADRRPFLWIASLVVAASFLVPVASGAAPSSAAVGASGPIGSVHGSPPTHAGATATSAVSHELLKQRIVAQIQSAHVPSKYAYYPNFDAGQTRTGGLVTPTYSHAPAPIGVADMGVVNTNGTPTGTLLDTSSFMGSITFNDMSAFYMDSDSTDYTGAQLNTVVSNITLLGNASNSFWTQNVITYSQRSNLLQFIDNIWNFSDPNFYMSPDVFNQTSPNGTLVAPSFYYALGPVVNISMPFTVNLFTNVTTTDVPTSNTTSLPYDIVWFNYSLYKSGAFQQGGSYDFAIFNSQNLASPLASIAPPHYQVNGYDLTPTQFLPYDAELVFCGPGGGSTTNLLNMNATLRLSYWNTTSGSFQPVPVAVAYGTNTGETADGIAEWYDASHTVHAGPGPTLPYDFWNSSPTAAPGHITVQGPVFPSNAFVFFNQSVAYNDSFSAWAPVPLGGFARYDLPLGDYSARVMMSYFDPISLSVLAATPSTWNISAVLSSDPAVGVYTPLYAFDNAQLAAISIGGSGAPTNPYLISDGQVGSLDPTFARMNDFTFPVFSGLLLAHTSDSVRVAPPPSFLVNFQGRTLTQALRSGLPTSNHLQIQLYGASHVTIENATGISGWFSGANLAGFPLASLMIWNSSNVLVAGNVFESQGTTLLMYGGTANTIWGNWFLSSSNLTDPNFQAAVMDGSFPFGPQLYESGDTIYNNVLENQVAAYSPAATIYYETFYGTFNSSWVNAWNISYAPATDAHVVNGVNLTGSIIGGSYQGGNLWWNYGRHGYYVPFEGFGLIAVGGDWLPLGGDTLTFGETGLPAGTFWSLTVGGLSIATRSTTTLLNLPDGSFDYSIGAVPGYAQSPAAGTVTLFQGPASVIVTFSFVPALYSLSIVEDGLPAATNWTASVNGATASSNTTTIVFAEPNGSYTWGVTPVAGRVLSPASGTVTVAGSDASVSVTFSSGSARGFTVSFVALGLPSGTTWSATLAGTTVSSGLGQIEFTEPNGTYPYVIGAVAGYASSTTKGNITVNGASTFLDVTFAALPVTLTGTVTPTSASVWLDGSPVVVASAGTFTVTVTPGIHSILASASGYYAYSNNVSVAVGSSPTVTIAMNPQSSGSSASSLSGTNLALLAGLGVLALIFLIGLVYFWSKARRPPVVMRPESATQPEGEKRPGSP